jgi:hypothetical protein
MAAPMGDEVGLHAFDLDGGDDTHQLIDSSILSMQISSTQQSASGTGRCWVLAAAALVNATDETTNMRLQQYPSWILYGI